MYFFDFSGSSNAKTVASYSARIGGVAAALGVL